MVPIKRTKMSVFIMICDIIRYRTPQVSQMRSDLSYIKRKKPSLMKIKHTIPSSLRLNAHVIGTSLVSLYFPTINHYYTTWCRCPVFSSHRTKLVLSSSNTCSSVNVVLLVLPSKICIWQSESRSPFSYTRGPTQMNDIHLWRTIHFLRTVWRRCECSIG